ncbi:MAG: HAMP domain-containing sensor histidine kinase [Chitinivibrionales bacterium]
MNKTPFFWNLFPAVFFLILILVSGMLFFTLKEVKHFYVENKKVELLHQASVLNSLISNFDIDSGKNLDSLLNEMSRETDIYYGLLDSTGRAVFESSITKDLESPSFMDIPEVSSALEGETGILVGKSRKFSASVISVALPYIKSNSKGIRVIQTAEPLLSVLKITDNLIPTIVKTSLILFLISVGLSLMLSKRLAKPLVNLENRAIEIAKGDFRPVSSVMTGPKEASRLSRAMNDMSREIKKKIDTITHQRDLQESILSSMTEGVIACDPGSRIILINQSAIKLLDLESQEISGKLFEGIVRISSLQNTLKKILEHKSFIEREITIHKENRGTVTLSLHGTPLGEKNQSSINGGLLVLNDITELKRLDNISKDFVSNVSHELRTPLTNLKGFVETLVQGAAESREDRERFLRIIEKQVNRLNSLVADLLAISKIENEKKEEIETSPCRISTVIYPAQEYYGKTIHDKNISLKFDIKEDIKLNINASLMEQALMNIIENAIKYSDPDTSIDVYVSRKNSSIAIGIRDQGPGIKKEHLPRIFERFYRVDKARSCSKGGTGLGLSIVKHIVYLHGGRVDVESLPGKGSVFTVLLPDYLEVS